MRGEKGIVFPLVLLVLLLGSMLVIPSLGLANNILRSKEINLEVLKEQYARDAAAEHAMWRLKYGGLAQTLGEDPEKYDITLNGVTVEVIVNLSAELGGFTAPGAEDDKIQVTKTVECDINDGAGFSAEKCSNVPKNPSASALARYIIKLEQMSPDTGDGLTVLFDELPTGFDYVPTSVGSPDSMPLFEPENVGTAQNPILKWDFVDGAGSPEQAVSFQEGDVKTLTFEAEINKSTGQYCNAVYLLPNREKTNKTTPILVGDESAGGCSGGGVSVVKWVDKQVAQPGVPTTFTYLIDVVNVDSTPLHIDSIRDVLPSGGFAYAPASTEVWITDDPLVGLPDDFTLPLGFSPFDDADLGKTFLPSERWQLVWDGPGGSGWGLAAAGSPGDTLILRFQVDVNLAGSGTYYNEVFIDVGPGCSAPQDLINEGVFTEGQEDEEYCTAYSWPTGGVVIPTYDVQSGAGGIVGQGNVILAADLMSLESWHVENK